VLGCGHIILRVHLFDGLLRLSEFAVAADVQAQMPLKEAGITLLKPIGLVDFYLVDGVVPEGEEDRAGGVTGDSIEDAVALAITSRCDFSGFTFLNDFEGDVQTFHAGSQVSDLRLNRLTVIAHGGYHIVCGFQASNSKTFLGDLLQCREGPPEKTILLVGTAEVTASTRL
jgi:hypothetical protein